MNGEHGTVATGGDDSKGTESENVSANLNLNVYCKAKEISTQNFGNILDIIHPTLSSDLVQIISNALSSGSPVEQAICEFCNNHAAEFGLSRALNAEDITAIQQ